ncbi:MAG: ABC transporter ATP-binding protein [Clostridia bacterium]|nr:ABC transporter ATP-binding protein [Clostridia bacterium]
MEILRVNNFSVTYDGEHNAADHVSFSMEQGDIVCIVGESGSGKSTVLHGVLGLQSPGAVSKGRVTLFGSDLSKLSKAELMKLRGEQVAMIFQDTGRYLNPISRVGRQFDAFLRYHVRMSDDELHALEKDMLQRVHLQDVDRVLSAYPFELSGGMRQRVGIAMAMALKPKLLLGDEPTSALDVTVQAQVVRQMMDLRDKYGTSLLIVTHNMGVAAYMSDYLGVMQRGRLVEWGRTEDVIRDPQTDYTRKLLKSVIGLNDARLKGAAV